MELIRGLAVLAEPPTDEHPRLADALGLPRAPSASDYSDVFLFQLYPYASVHLGAEGMLGGEARSRVAGFWRALGYDPPAEADHLAALLGLYATLVEREGALVRDARGNGPAPGGADASAEARLVREGHRALLHEHLAPWVFAFLTRVRELTDGPYGGWAALLEDVLFGEVDAPPAEGSAAPPRTPATGQPPSGEAGEARSADPLPLHLRTAPGLPDPRTEGAEAFVAGLLAPVRSGVIVTRADLARIASACDLGLRAGERRYALEHLLAQDAPPVLEALAAEASRQGELHDRRAARLGASARFQAGRARAAARLLRELASDESVAAGDPGGSEPGRPAGRGGATGSIRR